MSVLRIDGTSPECVEQVIRQLEDIGNIRRFSVFSQDIPQRYSDVPGFYITEDGERYENNSSYRLILECAESERAVWIEQAASGDEETETNGTVEILQILGVRMDYSRIAAERTILNENAQVEHNLNFIIRQKQTDDGPDDLSNEKLMKVMMKFDRPYDKWKTKEMLRMFGRIEPLRGLGGEEAEIYYFRTPFDTKQELPHCATNNVLTLHKRLEGADVETIHKLVQQIAEEHRAEITTRIYEKTPQ
ncbi:hypothetical protein ACFSL6_14500 [Paenibacillus thailandensis]|uniref:Uncharacterized protein n=1 Tax=Paenibacillus thailandensis TaxID=393250 RepID=A0ABW5QQI9_9BACL